MKKSVYLDSTIPSYYFDERESLKYPCEMTRKWWIINARLNLFTPEIITPLELFTEK